MADKTIYIDPKTGSRILPETVTAPPSLELARTNPSRYGIELGIFKDRVAANLGSQGVADTEIQSTLRKLDRSIMNRMTAEAESNRLPVVNFQTIWGNARPGYVDEEKNGGRYMYFAPGEDPEALADQYAKALGKEHVMGVGKLGSGANPFLRGAEKDLTSLGEGLGSIGYHRPHADPAKTALSMVVSLAGSVAAPWLSGQLAPVLGKAGGAMVAGGAIGGLSSAASGGNVLQGILTGGIPAGVSQIPNVSVWSPAITRAGLNLAFGADAKSVLGGLGVDIASSSFGSMIPGSDAGRALASAALTAAGRMALGEDPTSAFSAGLGVAAQAHGYKTPGQVLSSLNPMNDWNALTSKEGWKAAFAPAPYALDNPVLETGIGVEPVPLLEPGTIAHGVTEGIPEAARMRELSSEAMATYRESFPLAMPNVPLYPGSFAEAPAATASAPPRPVKPTGEMRPYVRSYLEEFLSEGEGLPWSTAPGGLERGATQAPPTKVSAAPVKQEAPLVSGNLAFASARGAVSRVEPPVEQGPVTPFVDTATKDWFSQAGVTTPTKSAFEVVSDNVANMQASGVPESVAQSLKGSGSSALTAEGGAVVANAVSPTLQQNVELAKLLASITPPGGVTINPGDSVADILAKIQAPSAEAVTVPKAEETGLWHWLTENAPWLSIAANLGIAGLSTWAGLKGMDKQLEIIKKGKEESDEFAQAAYLAEAAASGGSKERGVGSGRIWR